MNEELLLTAADAVVAERHRQFKLWGNQEKTYSEWMVVLMEEVGELAQAIQRNDGEGKSTDSENKLEEAIHVSAVAMKLAELFIEELEGANTLEPGTEEQPEFEGEFPFGFDEPETSGPSGGEGTT